MHKKENMPIQANMSYRVEQLCGTKSQRNDDEERQHFVANDVF